MTQAPKVLARWESDQGEFVELVKYPSGRRLIICRTWQEELERFVDHTDEFVIKQVDHDARRGEYNPSMEPKWQKTI
jgi:hypothetical protein